MTPSYTPPSPTSPSPFRYVEDYMGTNLVTGGTEQVKESIALWNNYFTLRYTNTLRQSRRTSANFVGTVSAPVVFTDEADQPGTKWAKDTYFGEASFLLEKHVKEKVGNLLELEKVLLTRATPEQFIAMHESFLPQTQTRIPLPAPSVWFYEGEARVLWAETYIPIAQAAHTYVNDVLAPVVKKAGDGGAALLGQLAAVHREVVKVHLQRAERQVKAGIRPDWGKASQEEKLAWATVEMGLRRRAILNGVFDPENEKDTSEEWKKESEQINALLQKAVEGSSVTLGDFWLHTFRREAMETQHILEEEGLARLGAAARVRLYDEVPLATILKDMAEVIAKGQLDLRAAVFRPHFNDTYSKMEYIKFGGSSIVQHTRTSSRELLFHYFASPREVAAAAKLYYSTKPMSSLVDYTSPYTHRKSIVGLCAEYGLDLTYARQFPVLSSAHHLANAEELVQTMQSQIARPYGVARRARLNKARAGYQRLLQPVSNIYVSSIPSELLETGAAEEQITASTSLRAAAVKEASPSWQLGTRKAVHYHWPGSPLEKLRRVTQSGPQTTERALEVERIAEECRIEVSLWRRVTPKEAEAAAAKLAEEEKQLEARQKATPELAEVAQYIARFHERVSQEVPSKTPEKEEWTFAVMLNDDVRVNVEEVAEVFLPFTTANGTPLPDGEYRVRVRVYDRESAIAAGATEEDARRGDPSVCAEAFSAPIQVVDVLPKLLSSYFGGSKLEDSLRVKGEDLLPLCAALREAEVDVPWQLEFEMGQSLDAKGTFSLKAFQEALRGHQYHRSLAEYGISDVQRGFEAAVRAHWELSHPGASEAEWAEARRAVLDHAAEKERDWWTADPILEVKDARVDSSSHRSLLPQNYPSTVRYGQEVCGVLSAEGTATASGQTPTGYIHPSSPVAPSSPLSVTAHATVDGSGAVGALRFSGAAATSNELDLPTALQIAKEAINQAKHRHASLSAFKTGPLDKQAQASLFCGVDSMEFGGKYARTYCYAVEKGKQELNELLAEGSAAIGAKDLERERVSDKEEVDRFASDSHPEQRKKLFVNRTTLSGENIEDPTPDQSSTWNRQ
ncbi:hypothetical protein AGDE_11772 [Angomonas deanei]|uniref:Uncharacterized protein n=1 Tax=Angomonas deanei TaxID=59799 RepID=A0A7G2CF27_9TRYP|nr:hypothetical protein AGDE_11772 [Angomonas deanei]CAD2218420.1 hypothetical protein, conserved [Angomonas deanei]|eukprot:EPY25435.1 hypothetical protein AGDE_11772 [Angomonas deanei]